MSVNLKRVFAISAVSWAVLYVGGDYLFNGEIPFSGIFGSSTADNDFCRSVSLDSYYPTFCYGANHPNLALMDDQANILMHNGMWSFSTVATNGKCRIRYALQGEIRGTSINRSFTCSYPISDLKNCTKYNGITTLGCKENMTPEGGY